MWSAPSTKLAEFPSVETVRQKIQGADPVDTAARQSAVFWKLHLLLPEVSQLPQLTLTAEERRLDRNYLEAQAAARTDGIARIASKGAPADGPASASPTFMRAESHYEASDAFEEEFFRTLFRSDSRVVADHRAEVATWEAKEKSRQAERDAGRVARSIEVTEALFWRLAKSGLVALCIVIVLLPFAWYVLERRRVVGMDPGNLATLHGSNGPYRLLRCTGRVLGTSKNLETHVSGGGGSGGYSAPVRSTTLVHDQFFLQDAAKHEHAFQVEGWDLALREGHVLSVVWAVREGAQTGPYLMMHNHTTNRGGFDRAAVKKVLAPSMLAGCLMVPVFPLFLIVWNLITSGRVEQFVGRGTAPLREALNAESQKLS